MAMPRAGRQWQVLLARCRCQGGGALRAALAHLVRSLSSMNRAAASGMMNDHTAS